MPRLRSRLVLATAAAVCLVAVLRANPDERLRGGFRNAEKNGWIFIHLEGPPASLGYQHGYLLSAEIEDAKRAIERSTTHEVKHNWTELRGLSEKIFVPKLTPEYRDELQGIVTGLKAHGSKLDLFDLVTMNAY